MPGIPLLQRVSDGEVFVQHLTKHLTRHLTIGGGEVRTEKKKIPETHKGDPGISFFLP